MPAIAELPKKKTIKVPQQLFRTSELERVTRENGETGLRMSISSDTPYKRYDWWDDEEYWEVLDHSESAMDTERLKAGLPILYNHDRDQHLARATSFENDGHKCSVGDLIWSESEFAQVKRKDAESGALPTTSIGYSLQDEGICVGAKDELPIYKFRFKIFEASLVTVPADISVGVGRNRDHKPTGEPKEIVIDEKKGIDLLRNENKTTLNSESPKRKKAMPLETEVETEHEIKVVKAREEGEGAGVSKERKRISDIGDLAKHFAEKGLAGRKIDTHEVASQFIRDGKSAAEFKDHVVMNEFPAIQEKVAIPDPKIGMSKKDRGRFSICKAILEEAMAHRGSGQGLTGIEKEASEASMKHLSKIDGSRSFSGLCIPDDILTANFSEDRDLSSADMARIADENVRLKMLLRATPLNATTFSSGGALVGTELLAGSLIDLLRNAALIGQGPLAITELGGLVGNIAIPKHTAAGTVYWMAEGAAVTESEVTFGQLVLSPKRMGADSAYTKQLLAQASLSVEAFVREDIAIIMAIEEDRVILYGSGIAGEPLGVFNTTGVGADVTFSGNATYAKIVGLEAGLENANVRNGQMAILTSPTSKSYMKITPKLGSTFPIYVWEKNDAGWPVINGVMPGLVNEYPAYATKQISTNVVAQGVFREIVKARWAGFDVVVDPYTGKKSETIEITVHQWMDVGIRHPQAFEVSVDAPTSP